MKDFIQLLESKLPLFLSGFFMYKKSSLGKGQEAGLAFQIILLELIKELNISDYQDLGNDDSGDGRYKGKNLEYKTHKIENKKNKCDFVSICTSEDYLYHWSPDSILSLSFLKTPQMNSVKSIIPLLFCFDFDNAKAKIYTVDYSILDKINKVDTNHINSRDRYIFKQDDEVIAKLVKVHDSKNQERGLFINLNYCELLYETDIIPSKDAMAFVMGLRGNAGNRACGLI